MVDLHGESPAACSLRARFWHLRTRRLEFSRLPMLMGIVNVTPDSFSDGGQFFDSQAAIERGMQLVEDGADILDIGGESTRPRSEPVAADEELRRVADVVAKLAEATPVPVSIDTSKARVARECMAAGAEIINDITGLTGDPEMVGVAAESGAGVCVMHMQGNPQTMQENPAYDDVVSEIFDFLEDRRDQLEKSGIREDRVCLDPGIGFGKSHQHNMTLMVNCERFHMLNRPLLVGHSRKGFLGKILGDMSDDRTAVTVGAALALAAKGVQVIRVHDVRRVREALLGFEAAGGLVGSEWVFNNV